MPVPKSNAKNFNSNNFVKTIIKKKTELPPINNSFNNLKEYFSNSDLPNIKIIEEEKPAPI